MTGNKTCQHETAKEAISLKVAVEKKKNRVVFAESNNDFIDVILSFLTLPIGTILSLLEGRNFHDIVIGCMNNLYASVCQLDAGFFRTEACKEMLMHPRRSSVAHECRKLKKYDDNLKTPKRLYLCKNRRCRMRCRMRCRGEVSEIPNARCDCGRLMDQSAAALLERPAGSVTCYHEDGGVFVTGGSKLFLITDNMQVMPGSASLSVQLLKKLGITDANELEIKSVPVGPEKVMQLLGQAFVSETPLTCWILSEQDSPNLTKEDEQDQGSAEIFHEHSNAKDSPVLTKVEQESSSESRKMRLVLFISKSQNMVLYAECEEDFADFLFSFLTFPLGSILKILDTNSQLGSFANLYRSVTDLGIHGHKNSAFGEKLDLFSVVNPKSPAGESKQSGGFVKGAAKFMVTDDLTVTLFSPIESISLIGKSNVPITDVHEISVEVGMEEAKRLFRIALISKTALTDVFIKRTHQVIQNKELFHGGGLGGCDFRGGGEWKCDHCGGINHIDPSKSPSTSTRQVPSSSCDSCDALISQLSKLSLG